VAAAALGAAGCCSVPAAQPLDAPLGKPTRVKIAFVGDLQRTSGLELWREQNDAERPLIIDHIAANHPSLVVMLGDLVFDGSSECQWAAFDELVAPLRLARVPCVTAIGNHDLWSGGRDNLDFVFQRFPLLHRSTYRLISMGEVAVVVLDSNHDEMPAETWEAQKSWFAATLCAIDANPAIRAAVVALHHPPYANSTVTDDDPVIGAELFPMFVARHKTVAMLAGHVHTYEHFDHHGKHLLVSGGGGGPRVTLTTGADPDHQDLFDELFPPPFRRPFHVVWLESGPDGLAFGVMGLPKGEQAFRLIDSFTVPWPSAASPPHCP